MDIHIHIHVGRNLIRGALVGLLLACSAAELASESVTLTTYYPAPSGVYRQMITTQDAYLARDGGTVSVGQNKPASLTVNGPVTIGSVALTSVGPSTLALGGGLRLGDDADACAKSTEGSVRYNRAFHVLEVCAPFKGLYQWRAPGSDPTVGMGCSVSGRNSGTVDCGPHAFCALAAEAHWDNNDNNSIDSCDLTQSSGHWLLSVQEGAEDYDHVRRTHCRAVCVDF